MGEGSADEEQMFLPWLVPGSINQEEQVGVMSTSAISEVDRGLYIEPLLPTRHQSFYYLIAKPHWSESPNHSCAKVFIFTLVFKPLSLAATQSKIHPPGTLLYPIPILQNVARNSEVLLCLRSSFHCLLLRCSPKQIGSKNHQKTKILTL